MSSGSHYIALSGLKARADELDRLASDLANLSTAGYKGERDTTAAAERPTFDRTLQSAIDTVHGGRRVDMADGALAPTGRNLDVAIDGKGFFVIDTPSGPRYTRNGHFTINDNRELVTDDGMPVSGADGQISLSEGEIRIEGDGSVYVDKVKAGQLAVVEFADPQGLTREGTRWRADGLEAKPIETPVVRAGMLEQSNVNVADRLAHLTTLSRSFEALQKSISMMLNDVDGRAIDTLGRRS
jgi:flagellar basal body rod protein FlgG